MSAARLLLVPVVVLAFSACGEKVQTIPVGAERRVDSQPWQNSDSRYVAPGWSVGDESSWNAQLARRVQAQNDYAQRK